MEKGSIHADAKQEALRYKWIESEKAGVDLGEMALRRWARLHWWGYLRVRWLEHLRGERFWIELDRGDFGLLQREFHDQPVLIDRVIDRLQSGWQNLDILLWATEWGIPTPAVIEILAALDINSRRIAHRFDQAFAPPLPPLDPDWLTWNNGTVSRLAWCIALEEDLEALPILGDALEEAGCTDRDILTTCRAAGRDIRWWWLIDLILERSWPLWTRQPPALMGPTP